VVNNIVFCFVLVVLQLCLTVRMNMVIILLIKYSLLDLRDIASLDGKDLKVTS